MRSQRPVRVLFTSVVLVLAVLIISPTLHGWWENGHFYTGRAAAEALPPQMPAFFRQSVDRLSYLNYEPDRWKNSAERSTDQALYGGTSPEHYINYEKVRARAAQADEPVRFSRRGRQERAERIACRLAAVSHARTVPVAARQLPALARGA